MPEVNRLAPELVIHTKTAEAALRRLEKQKLLVPQGQGRRRQIVLPDDLAPAALGPTILHCEPAVRRIGCIIDSRIGWEGVR